MKAKQISTHTNVKRVCCPFLFNKKEGMTKMSFFEVNAENSSDETVQGTNVNESISVVVKRDGDEVVSKSFICGKSKIVIVINNQFTKYYANCKWCWKRQYSGNECCDRKFQYETAACSWRRRRYCCKRWGERESRGSLITSYSYFYSDPILMHL